MAESTVKIVFLGDSSKLKRELDDVDGSTSKAETGFGKLGAAIGGALAVGSVVSLGKGAFDAAIESQKIAAQTEAVIKSTGAAAGITADEIGDMASAMSKKNAVDDEAIQTGQNLLLTFTNIGKADGVFERTSQAAIDMAAAMGTDVSSAAMQLGKALNDPTDGLSKLSRAGVQFTDEQKKQIKTMQDAGDMAGAQKVMLGELERQFGGSAAAQATATDRMKIAFGNLQEEIGAKLIPIVERLSRFMTDQVLPVFSWIGDHIGIVAAGFTVLAGAILGAVVPSFIAWATAAWAAAAAQIAAAAPAIALGVAIAALAAGLVYAYQNFDTFRGIVDGVAGFITGTVVPAFAAIASFLVDNLTAAFSGIVSFISGTVVPAFTALVGFVRDTLIPIFAAVVAFLVDALTPAFQAVVNFVTNVLVPNVVWLVGVFRDVLIPAFQAVISFIVDNIFPVIADFVRVLATIVTKVVDVARDVQRTLFDIVGYFIALGTGIWNVVKDIGMTLAGWVLDVWRIGGQVVDFFRELPGKIGDFFLGLAETIISPFRSAFNAIAGLWNRTVGSLSFSIPSWVPGGIGGKGWDVPDIPTFHTGGIVPGTGDVLSLLKGGEGVFTPEQMAAMGRGSSGNTFIINVYGSRSPQATADTVQRTLMSNQMRVALAGA